MLSALGDVLNNSAYALQKIMRSSGSEEVSENETTDAPKKTEAPLSVAPASPPPLEQMKEASIHPTPPAPSSPPPAAPIQPQAAPKVHVDELALDRWA